jgi:hypothetical protein
MLLIKEIASRGTSTLFGNANWQFFIFPYISGVLADSKGGNP